MLKGCVERSRCLVFKLNTRLLNPLSPRLNSSSNFSPDKSDPSICTAFSPESFHEGHKWIYREFSLIAAGEVELKISFMKLLLAVFLGAKVNFCSVFISLLVPFFNERLTKQKGTITATDQLSCETIHLCPPNTQF